VKTQQVTRRRGQRCGDIELSVYLENTGGAVPLVLDLHITHDRFGSSSDPSRNGRLHYPNNLDGPINEVRPPPNVISFMSPIPSTSGSLHGEFVSLLFLRLIGKLTVF
jgi:hypothetical protein